MLGVILGSFRGGPPTAFQRFQLQQEHACFVLPLVSGLGYLEDFHTWHMMFH
jgi:hypothetical protein